MRLCLLALPVFLALALADPVQAQNVLLPNDKESPPSILPPPTSSSLPTMPPAPESQSALNGIKEYVNKIISPARGSSSQPQAAQTAYLPPVLQQNLIRGQQNTLISLQKILSRQQQRQQSLGTQSSAAKTAEIQQRLAQLQADNDAAIRQTYAKLQAVQQRLQMLQSGPLKIEDIAGAYQSGN